jgi:transcriptional antiterminator NusG
MTGMALPSEPNGGQPADPRRGRWYRLHTYPGYEHKVKRSIEHRVATLDLSDRVFEVVVPRSGGTVLVRMEMDEDCWYVLRNTPGLTGFENNVNRPVALDDHERDE